MQKLVQLIIACDADIYVLFFSLCYIFLILCEGKLDHVKFTYIKRLFL